MYTFKERYDFVIINLMYTYFLKIGNTYTKSEGIKAYTGKKKSLLSHPVIPEGNHYFQFLVFPGQ